MTVKWWESSEQTAIGCLQYLLDLRAGIAIRYPGFFLPEKCTLASLSRGDRVLFTAARQSERDSRMGFLHALTIFFLRGPVRHREVYYAEPVQSHLPINPEHLQNPPDAGQAYLTTRPKLRDLCVSSTSSGPLSATVFRICHRRRTAAGGSPATASEDTTQKPGSEGCGPRYSVLDVRRCGNRRVADTAGL